MSSDVFVRARGLGKKFRFYRNPAERLREFFVGEGRGEDFWALRDVDFEVGPGECVGIIGRNGAGKSTLLELLCGTLAPTTGSIEAAGRVAALLQLGAGFNPDFSGLENVALAASLYGLDDHTIETRLPAIAAFAGIGDFLDRPVREYSSGMYARLAFAVCANVDADILAIDEILGVGDIRFQHKSIRFLREFRRKGIVFFVSHDDAAVLALCDRAIWLSGGRIAAAGPARTVVHEYQREMARLAAPERSFAVVGCLAGDAPSAAEDGEGAGASAAASPFRPGLPGFDPDAPPPADGSGRIESVALLGPDGQPLAGAEGGEDVTLAVTCRAQAQLASPVVLFALRDPMGQIVFAYDSEGAGAGRAAQVAAGARFDLTFDFRLPFLPTGQYVIAAYLLTTSGRGIACADIRDFAVTFPVLSEHISAGMANVGMLANSLAVSPEKR